jgi:hypothetical protein
MASSSVKDVGFLVENDPSLINTRFTSFHPLDETSDWVSTDQ